MKRPISEERKGLTRLNGNIATEADPAKHAITPCPEKRVDMEVLRNYIETEKKLNLNVSVLASAYICEPKMWWLGIKVAEVRDRTLVFLRLSRFEKIGS